MLYVIAVQPKFHINIIELKIQTQNFSGLTSLTNIGNL